MSPRPAQNVAFQLGTENVSVPCNVFIYKVAMKLAFGESEGNMAVTLKSDEAVMLSPSLKDF